MMGGSKNAEYLNWGRREDQFISLFCNFLDKFVFLWPGTIASSCMKAGEVIWTELVFNCIVLNYCKVYRTLWQRISLDCQTSFSCRETHSGFNLKTALTFFHTNDFAVSPKETWSLKNVFFPLIIPSVWQLIILSGQVVARPHIYMKELRLALCSTVTKWGRVWVLKDNDYCRIAECSHSSLSAFFQFDHFDQSFLCRCKPLVVSTCL